MTVSGSSWPCGSPTTSSRCSPRGHSARCAAVASCPPSTCTSRSRSSAPDLRPSCRRSSAALRAAVDAAVPPELAVGRWRETRSVGMLTLADATGAAASLAADLHRRLEALGVYRAESRRWLAHVTVLRFRERPRLRPPLPDVRTFVPSDAAAYLSRLHPSGARYEVLESVPLDRTHNEDTVGRSEV